MHSRFPVVAGVDGARPIRRVLELAAAEAELRGTSLRIVAVRDPADGAGAKGALEAALRWSSGHHPGLDVEPRLVVGQPAAVLIEQSGAACLTVVGRAGHGPLRGLPSGSVAVQVAMRGHGPVLVVADDASSGAGAPVLLGVDADAPAGEAIEFAFAEAELRGVGLRAFYAWSHKPAGGPFAPIGYDYAEADEQARRLLAEAVAGWAEKYPDVVVEQVAEHSLDPPAALLAASGRAGLVVIGPHDPGALRQLLLGSVGQTLTHRSRCPVMVVRSRFG